jgi:hypothetical protein
MAYTQQEAREITEYGCTFDEMMAKYPAEVAAGEAAALAYLQSLPVDTTKEGDPCTDCGSALVDNGEYAHCPACQLTWGRILRHDLPV